MAQQKNDASGKKILTREICLEILYAALLEQTDLAEVAACYGTTAFKVYNWGNSEDIEIEYGSEFVSVEITKENKVALDDLGSR